MSNISQFGSGGVKSIQRGVISVSSGSYSATATITAVDTSKTELRFLGGYGLDVGAYTNIPRIALTNTTTITATTVLASGATPAMVSWELTEFY